MLRVGCCALLVRRAGLRVGGLVLGVLQGVVRVGPSVSAVCSRSRLAACCPARGSGAGRPLRPPGAHPAPVGTRSPAGRRSAPQRASNAAARQSRRRLSRRVAAGALPLVPAVPGRPGRVVRFSSGSLRCRRAIVLSCARVGGALRVQQPQRVVRVHLPPVVHAEVQCVAGRPHRWPPAVVSQSRRRPRPAFSAASAITCRPAGPSALSINARSSGVRIVSSLVRPSSIELPCWPSAWPVLALPARAAVLPAVVVAVE